MSQLYRLSPVVALSLCVAWPLSFTGRAEAQADASLLLDAAGSADAGVAVDAGSAVDKRIGIAVPAADAAASTLQGAAGEVPSAAPPAAPLAVPSAPAAASSAGDVAEGRPRAILRGTVTSADDEGPIAGARVYVRGDKFEAETDSSGAFSLGLYPGTYQLSIIATGFSTQNISKVEVRATMPAQINIKLQPGSMALDDMVVTGSRVKGGIATLLAERRESKAVADVIGAEQMARSGDTNAAAALSRVTGITVIDGRWVLVRGMSDRYSSLTLNGFQVASPDPTRRVVPLDIFPAGFIDSVVVQKTYTPDLPGEFGGGLVQLRSRDYPHEFVFNLNVATGGNSNSIFRDRLTYSGGKYDLLGIDDGKRDLPKEFKDPRGKLVVENIANQGMGYSEDEINALAKRLPRKYNTRKETTLPDLTMGANIGNEWRLRYAKIGFVTGAGYRSEYRTIPKALNIEGNQGNQNTYNVSSYRRQISLSAFLDWGVEFSAQHKLKATTMLLRQTDDSAQGRLEPTADQGRTTLQWVERQVLLQQVLGKHVFTALRNFQADWRYGFGMATRLQPSQVQYIYGAENGVSALLPGSGNNSILFSDLKDKTHEGALDLAQPFTVWQRLDAKIKAGAFIYRRDRTANSRAFEYLADSAADRTGTPNQVLAADNIGSSVGFQEVTRPTDSYNGWSQVEAGYGHLELPIVRSLDIAGGARVEHAHIEVKTFDPFDPAAPPTTAKLDNLDVLPSASLTWRFIEDFQARLGYSRTLNRPDFRELSSSRYFDLETNLLYQGNPNAKRALIENFDARLEWYYTPEEVFSIGGFLKRFQNPIETKLTAGQETLFTVENVDKAISYGLEVEGRKRFGFIAKALSPLYVSTNFSLIHSAVKVPLNAGGTHDRPLQGQSPWVINAQLGWDDSDEGGTGTAASFLYNVAGKRIRVVGDINQGVDDTYELSIHRLDFVITQNLPHKFKIGARARNILNAVERWQDGDQIVRRFRRGADFQVSLAWSY